MEEEDGDFEFREDEMEALKAEAAKPLAEMVPSEYVDRRAAGQLDRDEEDNDDGAEGGGVAQFVKLHRHQLPGFTVGDRWLRGSGVPDGLHHNAVEQVIKQVPQGAVAQLISYRNSTVLSGGGRHGSPLETREDRQDYEGDLLSEAVTIKILSAPTGPAAASMSGGVGREWSMTVHELEALFDAEKAGQAGHAGQLENHDSSHGSKAAAAEATTAPRLALKKIHP